MSMTFDSPLEPYIAIKLYRVAFGEHTVQCATTGSTGVLLWTLNEHTRWCSTQYGIPDLVTAFIPKWAAIQYPSIRAALGIIV
jgi:hypothetical protein